MTGVLACPECQAGLVASDRSLRCARGHSFDIAKQGYITLLTGASTKMTGDTAAMLDARAAFQGGGHFAPIADATVAAVAGDGTSGGPGAPVPPSGLILEIGAGTGYYLGRVLDALPHARGVALDVAKPAGRRGARAHPRAAAVVADAWRGLPLRDNTVDAALSVFAPRNPGEAARVLTTDGRFVVVTPTSRHLAELIEPLGMVSVDPDKQDRLTATMSGHFELCERDTVEYPMKLSRTDIAHVVAMGPSAHHASAAESEFAALPDTMEVTASVLVSTYRPAGA
ncbi:methyltransferase domain-containing protein [Nocardia cyriacigeorgica]|uniref:Methyltransferase domain-containing protein n=1 Tax=Nocardia cyriacigeorgica TaxID=135487 RepID=A0ABX0CGH3_9NOCA|nr:methyltransferase domain-containing protein [Nocardia cyriacigeorgica]NEW40278.1 methyltransferase domain-containing protein [Nocardia cyriacigeorgica]NEW50774.1 methyltransferase domain-containing protein [Nocardia cyriacigeorgica]NEW54738.1 methyltransferase domain-containing protein [Nocardia cyriacigeorgica]